MASYVLVHGGLSGGWQLQELAARLRAAGHEAFTPTLTGLGERSHLLTPDVDLNTHILDIVKLLTGEDLRDVILLGKSYAGVVITGAAEQAPERLRHLVYLDAVVPEDGRSVLDLAEPEHAAFLTRLVEEHGDGWRLPVPPNADPRLTDHPFRTFTQPLVLKNPAAAAVPRTYIRCMGITAGTMHARMTARAAELAQAQGWRYHELPCDHDAERLMPEAVTALLLDLEQVPPPAL
jgi:pimeloyl-ACP methyl ester carboxylesterase